MWLGWNQQYELLYMHVYTGRDGADMHVKAKWADASAGDFWDRAQGSCKK